MKTPLLTKNGKLTKQGERFAAFLRENRASLREAKSPDANFYAHTVLGVTQLLTPVQFFEDYPGFTRHLYSAYRATLPRGSKGLEETVERMEATVADITEQMDELARLVGVEDFAESDEDQPSQHAKMVEKVKHQIQGVSREFTLNEPGLLFGDRRTELHTGRKD